MILFTYLPLATAGLALITALIRLEAFSTSFSAEKLILPTGAVNNAGLVHAELHFTGLDLFHRLDHVHRDGAGLGVRHEAARPENLTQLTHRAHHVRGSDHGVEIGPAFRLDLVDHVVAAHKIGPGFGGLALFIAASDHQHADRLAKPVGKHHSSAHHLIGVLGIHAKINGEFNSFVELGVVRLLDQLRRIGELVGTRFHLLTRGLHVFA